MFASIEHDDKSSNLVTYSYSYHFKHIHENVIEWIELFHSIFIHYFYIKCVYEIPCSIPFYTLILFHGIVYLLYSYYEKYLKDNISKLISNCLNLQIYRFFSLWKCLAILYVIACWCFLAVYMQSPQAIIIDITST